MKTITSDVVLATLRALVAEHGADTQRDCHAGIELTRAATSILLQAQRVQDGVGGTWGEALLGAIETAKLWGDSDE